MQRDKDSVLSHQNNKTYIKDAAIFTKVMMGENVIEGMTTNEAYSTLYEYGVKQIKSFYADVPYDAYPEIINVAITKALKDFDKEKNTAFLSYYYFKIKGEVHIFRSKRNSLNKKIVSMVDRINYGEDSSAQYVKEYSKEENKSELVLIDTQTVEDKIIAEDAYFRRIKAFKMAFSFLPRITQYILYESGSGKKSSEIAMVLGITPQEVNKKKMYGLSLLLQKVLRSNHLTQDEKKEIIELHGIYNDEI